MGLTVNWSAAYHPEWDATPARYVERGLVAPGRSRRLARAQDDSLAFKAYLGVQHYDPTRYGIAGEPQTRFFLSLFVRNRTVTLRTFSTLDTARDALERFHTGLRPS